MAEEVGVTFVAGPDFFLRGGASAARLAFSFASPGQLGEAVSRLATVIPAAPAVELREQHAA